jgi:hypothetical protein
MSHRAHSDKRTDVSTEPKTLEEAKAQGIIKEDER